MKFIMTVRQSTGELLTYFAIGNRDALCDAAYDAGALGVTAMVAA